MSLDILQGKHSGRSVFLLQIAAFSTILTSHSVALPVVEIMAHLMLGPPMVFGWYYLQLACSWRLDSCLTNKYVEMIAASHSLTQKAKGHGEARANKFSWQYLPVGLSPKLLGLLVRTGKESN